MNDFRFVKRIETNGAMQMAIDETILNQRIGEMVPNTLRFFTWKPSCITIGYFQSLKQEVDLEKTKEMGVDVVRRYTGGGAVYHENELTYSIAISEKEISQDILESYKKLCNGITLGLKELGINAEFKPINDIIVNGKKVSGNAQTRKQGIILQHGTILLDVDVKKMFSLLKVPSEKIRDKMISVAGERVTSINNILGKKIALNEVENAIKKGFEKTLDTNFIESEISEKEMSLAKKLCAEKYSTKEWSELR